MRPKQGIQPLTQMPMRWVAGLLILAAVSLVSCGRSAPDTAKAEAPQPVRISTANVEVRNVQAAFEETGSFVADESSDIAPPVAGRIIRTPANVGDWVKQGQVIAELDHRDAELQLEQARARLAEIGRASCRERVCHNV